MTYLTAYDSLWKHFATEWGATTLVKYENTAFVTPIAKQWVSLSFIPETSRQVAICANGMGDYRYTGGILIEIYIPESEGAQPAHVLANRCEEIFRGKKINGIYVKSSQPIAVLPTNESKTWFRLNLFYPTEYTINGV